MITQRSMFQRRHYDFLVQWAATNIKPTAVASLADVLQVDNPRFDRKRFLKTYVELRRFTRLHETLQPNTPTGEIVRWIGEQILVRGRETEEERRRFNAAADAIIEAAADAIIEADLKEAGIDMSLKASPEAVERSDDVLGPKHSLAHAPFPAPQRPPVPDMDAYLRKHAVANAGRGMWEYTRCWKCADGTRPDLCPVGCRGACEYPSAVND